METQTLSRKIGRGMGDILRANLLQLLCSLATSFLLPRFLSVDSYAQIKTYQLYASYLAVLHLGFNDGMYLRFGGMQVENLNVKSLETNIGTLRIFQLAVTVVCLAAAWALGDPVLWMVSAAVLPTNLVAWFSNFYRAVGEFRRYSRILNWMNAATFAIHIWLLFVVRTDNFMDYLAAYVGLRLVIWLLLEISFRDLLQRPLGWWAFSARQLVEDISGGIPLLLGNSASLLMTGMDRWFVKFRMGPEDFAQYAFSAGLAGFLHVAAAPVSITLYHSFCQSEKQLGRVRDMVMVLSLALMGAEFPAQQIIRWVLPSYAGAGRVLVLLFGAEGLTIFLKAIYGNLYAARKQQKRYANRLLLALAAGFGLNCLCFRLWRTKEAFALATLLSVSLWFFLSKRDFPVLAYGKREWGYLLGGLGVFLLAGFTLEPLPGMLGYYGYLIGATCLLLPEAWAWLWDKGRQYLQKG